MTQQELDNITEGNSSLLLQTLCNFADASFDLPLDEVQQLIEAQMKEAIKEAILPKAGNWTMEILKESRCPVCSDLGKLDDGSNCPCYY